VQAEPVKVVFELEQDEDNWPPVSAESAWATPLGSDEYRLENVPWFARGYAFGDIVAAEPDVDGIPQVRRQVSWSGRYTVRVIPLGGDDDGQVQAIIDDFVLLGADCEGALPSFSLVALDIPPTARVAEIKALLVEGEGEGRWGYEEGCVDDRWRRL
jgi:hypothetical protein